MKTIMLAEPSPISNYTYTGCNRIQIDEKYLKNISRLTSLQIIIPAADSLANQKTNSKGSVQQLLVARNITLHLTSFKPEAEFKEFKPRRVKPEAKNRFQLSAGSNLETLNTISSGTNHV